jgi:hypothetical protein
MLCCSAGFVTGMKIEQLINLKFLVKLKKKLHRMFPTVKGVYSVRVTSRTRVFEWHKRFVEGPEEVEDDERRGHPSTSKTEENIEKMN